ncbi:hypothetical protein STEG23_001794 [Scotinomys teguina]
MQPGRTTNTGGGTMEVKAAAMRCQLLLIVLTAVMLLPVTGDEEIIAACSEKNCQDHRVKRKHRQNNYKFFDIPLSLIHSEFCEE